jgi:hypothetical protein
MSSQHQAPAALPPGMNPGTHVAPFFFGLNTVIFSGYKT